MKEERRQGRRYLFESAVALESLEADETSVATMYNYSKKGLYFESDDLITPGSEIFLGLAKSPYVTNPGTYECHRVTVKWSQELDRSAYKYGYGVQHNEPPKHCPLGLVERLAPRRPPSDRETTAENKELRKHPRRQFPKPVVFATRNQYYQGTIGNISRGGAFISTKEGFALGQKIKMIIPDTKYEKDTLIKGRIVRLGPSGVGVKFTGIQKRKTS